MKDQKRTPTSARMRGLYAITDPVLLPGDRLLKGVEAALRGGAVWIQYRDKQAGACERLSRALALNALCRQYGRQLLINDDVDLALRVGAAGVHLGQDDGDVRDARRRLGPDAILGVTCHDQLTLAEQAVAAGASYLAFGRFFGSSTKPGAPPAQLDTLTEARRRFDLPIVAIGGIDLERAPRVIGAGADMVAVIADLFSHADIQAQALRFQHLFSPMTEVSSNA